MGIIHEWQTEITVKDIPWLQWPQDTGTLQLESDILWAATFKFNVMCFHTDLRSESVVNGRTLVGPSEILPTGQVMGGAALSKTINHRATATRPSAIEDHK